ncbi:lytic transglycosylase domain-containing protein [Neolewinella litorea]|uniref:Lytic transglycosylase domain-containing protein n=1 Tax=Neolewinella litorea TaxID=2562452 RepID=A0A4S4NK87_9BACT|nr:lytic transglycosylase domain-containing protein [Neolewinella litorea]THH39355.1 lytic transglycosylase domain-containing protein [Neolewinella litorea]
MSKLQKGLCQVLLMLLVTVPTLAHATLFTPTNNTRARSQMVNRVQRLNLPLKVEAADDFTKRKIADYLELGGRSTEKMLGRANQYFPVFEYYLRKHDMPATLKYLAVAESMLVPGAVSSMSAAGLWQLMPATAREMGLRVDGVIDERLDLYRSTEAAVVMLKTLHAEFNDWHLALAAYNCGSGRVRQAIRSAGSQRYKLVERHLPSETQRYVAAYVAAAYAVNYYEEHGLVPHEMETTDYVFVHRRMTLAKIARECDLRISTLRRLNPNFVQAYIPGSVEGYRLRIPAHKKHTVQQFLWGRPNLVELPLDENLDVADATATLLGYDPYLTLLGARAETLIYERPVWNFVQQRESMLLNFFHNYRAVASL